MLERYHFFIWLAAASEGQELLGDFGGSFCRFFCFLQWFASGMTGFNKELGERDVRHDAGWNCCTDGNQRGRLGQI